MKGEREGEGRGVRGEGKGGRGKAGEEGEGNEVDIFNNACIYYTMNATMNKQLSLVLRKLYNIDLWSPPPPNV